MTNQRKEFLNDPYSVLSFFGLILEGMVTIWSQ